MLYQGRQLNPVKSEIYLSGLPALEAVPVRDMTAVLTGGDFSAVATLELDYQ